MLPVKPLASKVPSPAVMFMLMPGRMVPVAGSIMLTVNSV